jgi:hypothetical protein
MSPVETNVPVKGAAMLHELRWSIMFACVAVFIGLDVELSHAQSIYVQSVGSGGQAGNKASSHCSASSDGRYVAFASLATNLVPGHGNGFLQVYWHDRQTGKTTILSTNAGGADGNQDSGTYFVSVSGDGRQVAFDSMATNLLPGYGNTERQVYHHDTVSGVTKIVSRSSKGFQGNDDSGYTGVSLSKDGRYVAFNSRATNLVNVWTYGMAQVYRHDVVTGVTTIMSTDSKGAPGDNASFHCRISGDGLSVAFGSKSKNLVPGYDSGQQVYVRNVQTGATKILSVDSNGVAGNGPSGDVSPSLSHDGRYVTFASLSTNLVPGYGNGKMQVYLRDVQASQTTIVSTSSNEVQGNYSSGTHSICISPDSRYVAFDSWASNLVPGYRSGGRQVYVRDVVAGTTSIASIDPKGKQSNGENGANDVSISSGGRFVTFDSSATNLVSGVPWTVQIYQRDLDTSKDRLVLDTSPNPIHAGEELVSVTSLGIPGHLASLWWIGTDHVLHNPVLIMFGLFSAGGTWEFDVQSFPDLGLSISELTLASFSTGPNGGGVHSQPVFLSTP